MKTKNNVIEIYRARKFLILLLVLTVLFLLYPRLGSISCENKKAIGYRLENKHYCLLVADSQDERSKGLMFYKKPVDFEGMIFIFPDKAVKTFWNENTYLDLDVYWLDGDKVVGKSELPSIEKSGRIITVSSEREIDKVVEIIR